MQYMQSRATAHTHTFMFVKEAQLRGVGFHLLCAALHSRLAHSRMLHPQNGRVIACSQSQPSVRLGMLGQRFPGQQDAAPKSGGNMHAKHTGTDE